MNESGSNRISTKDWWQTEQTGCLLIGAGAWSVKTVKLGQTGILSNEYNLTVKTFTNSYILVQTSTGYNTY